MWDQFEEDSGKSQLHFEDRPEYQIIDITFASTNTKDLELLTKLKNLHVELTELNEHLNEYEKNKYEPHNLDMLVGKCDFLPCCHTIESRIKRDKVQFRKQRAAYLEAKKEYIKFKKDNDKSDVKTGS